ncbi:MAG TPA: hypothetical protein VHN77_09125 [Phycisphaerales bacterium]|nr:hypothetical protein [Phycisphaerales bacterium]
MRMGLLGVVASITVCTAATAQFSVQSQFATVSSVGMAYDHVADHVWVYPDFGSTLQRYSTAGALLGSVPRPGESANDADVEITVGPLTIGSTALPDGTLLFINGETGVADVYAIDKASGAVLATLNTAFGVSHVVGGAHHPQRGTLFLVQDRVPSGSAQDNLIAEVNPQTGTVLATFQTTTAAPTFTVNYGDIEVLNSGNLLVVSEDETQALELTPTGSFVALHNLPTGVVALAGVGFDPTSCEVWTIRTNGQVTRMAIGAGGPACVVPCDTIDFNNDGLYPDTADIDDFLSVFSGGPCSTDPVPGCSDVDFNNDGLFPDTADIDALLSVFSGGSCF